MGCTNCKSKAGCDDRKGDNLYTCSIVALDVTTGKLKWHYQTTPHDEWDWDAVQPVRRRRID